MNRVCDHSSHRGCYIVIVIRAIDDSVMDEMYTIASEGDYKTCNTNFATHSRRTRSPTDWSCHTWVRRTLACCVCVLCVLHWFIYHPTPNVYNQIIKDVRYDQTAHAIFLMYANLNIRWMSRLCDDWDRIRFNAIRWCARPIGIRALGRKRGGNRFARQIINVVYRYTERHICMHRRGLMHYFRDDWTTNWRSGRSACVVCLRVYGFHSSSDAEMQICHRICQITLERTICKLQCDQNVTECVWSRSIDRSIDRGINGAFELVGRAHCGFRRVEFRRENESA